MNQDFDKFARDFVAAAQPYFEIENRIEAGSDASITTDIRICEEGCRSTALGVETLILELTTVMRFLPVPAPPNASAEQKSALAAANQIRTREQRVIEKWWIRFEWVDGGYAFSSADCQQDGQAVEFNLDAEWVFNVLDFVDVQKRD